MKKKVFTLLLVTAIGTANLAGMVPVYATQGEDAHEIV